jgi:FMN-dependent oxidoreductase (nitrilotriacetate monooxygenase family)
MSDNKKMKLGLFLFAHGHHVGGWRHPKADPSTAMDYNKYVEWAQTAERALFDTIFLADTPAMMGYNAKHPQERPYSGYFDPLTLLAALSTATRHIGLIATATTTYDEPYHIARRFASLDHLSGGRAGWNLVTSWVQAASLNFGKDAHPDHVIRYERALEFFKVVTGLWDTWQDDPTYVDEAGRVCLDLQKVRALDHVGKHFSVKGPLNVPRPVQGHPIVVQAGASETGRDVAAQTADVVFVAYPTFEEARDFYQDIKQRVARFGRNPDNVKIMPGVSPIIGRTQAEADALLKELQDQVPIDVALQALSTRIDFDISGYPLDGPLPDIPETNGGKSRQKLLVEMAQRDGLTIRQLAHVVATSRGFFSMVGTPEKIADELEFLFRNGAADGFNIMPPYMSGGLNDFVELVVPILQKRGLFRTEYEGTTLRENLGVPRPERLDTASPAARAA